MRIAAALLTRIRKPELAIVRRTVSDEELRASVLEHLRNICQTRRGTMVTCADYGIADVSEMLHSFPDAIAEMARSIRHTIQHYEPRLSQVRIRHIPTEDLTLRYEISAQLVRGNGKTPVSFSTSLEPSRRIRIE